MIDKTIKNIKRNTLILQREYLQQKYQKKKLYKTLEGILTAKIANIVFFNFFLSFLYIKVSNIKMSLISAEGYKNAGVNLLKIEETDELWIIMKDFGVGLGVKSISDIVLKEIHHVCEKKKLKGETKCYKMTESEFDEKFYKLSEDELNTKSNNVFVKNTIITNIINHCRSEKKR